MAANISSGNGQSYDPGEGNRIFQGLDPDVALVQEMNVGSNSAPEYRSWVNANFGSSFSYFVESGKNIPNGIVSRYPIIDSGVWDDPEIGDREFVWARIDLPGEINLLAVSVHFKASSGSTNVSRRNNQAEALVSYIGGEIEPTDRLVIAGDFNTYSRTEACVGTLSSRVVTTAPWPADQAGNTNTNSGQTSPYDWVMPGPGLAAWSTPLVIGSNTFPNGLVFDSRDYSPLAEVSPVQLGDSGATGMQHMAVMRAFLVPTNDPPVIAGPAVVSASVSQNGFPDAFGLTLAAADADGDPLSWSISGAASHGTASLGPPASGGSVAVKYQPANDYTGGDSFVARVSDGRGGTDTVTVVVTVNPVSALDAWTYDHFAPLAPETEETLWGDAADPDRDGLRNIEEFAQGLDPMTGDSGPALLACAVTPAEGTVFLSYKIRMDGGSPALDYEVQTVANLGGIWAELDAGEYTVTGETDLGGGFILRTLRLDQVVQPSTRFFRLGLGR